MSVFFVRVDIFNIQQTSNSVWLLAHMLPHLPKRIYNQGSAHGSSCICFRSVCYTLNGH